MELKILLGFYLIATKIDSVYEVTMPHQVKRLLASFSVVVSFGFDGIGAPLECLGFSGYRARLLGFMLAPLALSIAVIGIGLATGIRLLLQPVPDVPLWMGIVYVVLSLVVIALIYTDKSEDDYKAIDLDPAMFRTRMTFNIAAVMIILILTFIYAFLA